jgi:hypothetical protein
MIERPLTSTGIVKLRSLTENDDIIEPPLRVARVNIGGEGSVKAIKTSPLP